LSSRAQFDEILARYRAWRAPFLDERGELKPAYRPPELTPSFLRTDADPGGPEPGLRVPPGAVEWW
jgi:hypothetical protein